MFRYNLENNHSYSLDKLSDGELVANYNAAGVLPTLPNYLGAILTEDRSNVLWVNNSKPLP